MDLRPIFNKIYKVGSIGPGTGDLEGQCAVFAQALINIPKVGDSYAQKKQAVKDFGILKENLVTFQIGDCVITSDGVNWLGKGNGHVFVVADMDQDNLYAAESNFSLNKKVGYGRKVPKNSSKIYGVIRGDFKFDAGINFPITFNTTFFMQYQKQWKGDPCGELANRVKVASQGQVVINPGSIYTYDVLKNWWYKYYGSGDGTEFFKVIDKAYYDGIVMPLALPHSHIAVWAVNKQQWEGAVFNHPESREIGWYYRPSKPGQLIFSCDEGEMSPASFGVSMFNDAAFHEMGHLFYTFGRKDQADNTHNRHFGWNNYPKNLDQIFNDIDLTRLAINLL